ncbi:T9SS type A sorting domain-containing protein [Aureispira anguillae]|uniref:T9SS type A sorting domain-containing protein n=1 Tax=Aureispira anguillae TaxID=2864201 RepID=A0A915YE50_9BACT|nr:T9SS type A sorting domain-containing protein [Aureispira anguillae]BDS11450.1 T9SS type A sorting domain-containing protein [Aureispira anguillae]
MKPIKNLLALFLCLLFIHEINAQNPPALDWVKTMHKSPNAGWGGVSAGIKPLAMCTDADKNIYIAGLFSDSVDFDPSANTNYIVSNHENDFFVQKLDSNGTSIWVKNFGKTTYNASSYQDLDDIEVDNNGNVYIVGSFLGSVDFDPGPNTHTTTDLHSGLTYTYGSTFVLQLDANGDFVRVGTIKSLTALPIDIKIDANNNVYVVGFQNHYNSISITEVNFGATSYQFTTSTNNFLLKLDSNGELLWIKELEGAVRAMDLEGNSLVITGLFEGTKDFDPNSGTYNLTSGLNYSGDMYVQKLDLNGNLVWAKSMQGVGSNPSIAGWSAGEAVNISETGDIYLSGKFKYTVDFDPSAGSYNLSSTSDASNTYGNRFIQKITSNGDLVWVKKLKSYNSDYASNYDDYNLISIGLGQDDLLVINNYDKNAMMSMSNCFDSSGTFHWFNKVPAKISDVFLDELNNIYTIGDFSSPYDFDLGIGEVSIAARSGSAPSGGENVSGDMFLAKYRPCANIDTAVTQVATTLTANVAGATYQWIDCSFYNHITGATSQSFTPTSDGNYAVIITQNACSDTSSCFNVTNTSITKIGNTNIHIYPNPTKGFLQIDLGALENIRLQLLTINGQVVEALTTGGSITNLDLRELPTGVYLLKVIHQNETGVYKIIKE